MMVDWTTYVQTASWAGATITAAFGVWRFGQDTKAKREANEVARRELDWRRSSAAQTSLEKMESDPLASDAVLMLDWDGREFPSANAKWRLSKNDVLNALRCSGEAFAESEVYIRDAMDRLLWHFERIQQQIDIGLIDRKHVRFPLGYVVALMNERRAPFDGFMTAYGYTGAQRLMRGLEQDGVPVINADYEKLFLLDGATQPDAQPAGT